MFNIFNEECPLINKGKTGYNSYEDDFLEMIRVIDEVKSEEVVQPAIFELKMDLGSKLSDILSSADPMIVGLFRHMKVEMNMKLHANQYTKILENTTEKKYKHFFGKKEGEGEKKEEEGGPKEEDKSEKEKSEAQSSRHEDEDNGYGDEDDEGEDDDDDYGEEADNDALGVKSAFKALLPFFLFQWDTKVTMKPDLDDIRDYCKDQKQYSHLFNSFKEYVQRARDIELQLTEDKRQQQAFVKKGSKAEMMNYLIQEVGQEIEFIWKTKLFYM